MFLPVLSSPLLESKAAAAKGFLSFNKIRGQDSLFFPHMSASVFQT